MLKLIRFIMNVGGFAMNPCFEQPVITFKKSLKGVFELFLKHEMK
jgi:hypothetical protein